MTLEEFRSVLLRQVADADMPDLSARQLAVLLTVYTTEGPHTVRGLAAALNVSKPAITRALNRLETLRIARRQVEPLDRRSIVVLRTREGFDLLARLKGEKPRPRKAA